MIKIEDYQQQTEQERLHDRENDRYNPEQDEFYWVNHFHMASLNNRGHDDVSEIYLNAEGNISFNIEPFASSKITTFILYEHRIVISKTILQKIFDAINEYKIETLIFNDCWYEQDLHNMIIPSCLRDVVFNNCRNPRHVIHTFLSVRKGEEYSLKRIVIKGVHFIGPILKSIDDCLTHSNNYIREIKLINCKPSGGESYRNIASFGHLDKVLSRNKQGYLQCRKACIILLLAKKYRRSSLFNNLDGNVVRLIVKIIWKTRYNSLWHDNSWI